MNTDVVFIFALNSPFFFSCIWQRDLVGYVIFVGGLAYLTYYIFLTPLFSLSRTPFQ